MEGKDKAKAAIQEELHFSASPPEIPSNVNPSRNASTLDVRVIVAAPDDGPRVGTLQWESGHGRRNLSLTIQPPKSRLVCIIVLVVIAVLTPVLLAGLLLLLRLTSVFDQTSVWIAVIWSAGKLAFNAIPFRGLVKRAGTGQA